MPQFARRCDVYQGYNFKKDKNTTVGFIKTLKIGDTEIKADQTCKDPTASTTDMKVVSVLNNILWGTGVTDAVYLSGQVSITNKQNIAALTFNEMIKIDVQLDFDIYDYDPLAKKYFLSLSCKSTKLEGILEKNGSELNLSVADDCSTEVQSPENYVFQIGVKPQPKEQKMEVSTSDTNKFMKFWGLTVS